MALDPLGQGPGLEAPRGLGRGLARLLAGGRRDGPELSAAPAVLSAAPGRRRHGRRQSRLPRRARSCGRRQPTIEGEPPAASDPVVEGVATASPLPDVPRRVLQTLPERPAAPTEHPAPAPLTRATADAAPGVPAGVVSAAPPRTPGRGASVDSEAVARADAPPGDEHLSPPGAEVVSAPAARSALGEFRPRRVRRAFREPQQEPAVEEQAAPNDASASVRTPAPVEPQTAAAPEAPPTSTTSLPQTPVEAAPPAARTSSDTTPAPTPAAPRPTASAAGVRDSVARRVDAAAAD